MQTKNNLTQFANKTGIPIGGSLTQDQSLKNLFKITEKNTQQYSDSPLAQRRNIQLKSLEIKPSYKKIKNAQTRLYEFLRNQQKTKSNNTKKTSGPQNQTIYNTPEFNSNIIKKNHMHIIHQKNPENEYLKNPGSKTVSSNGVKNFFKGAFHAITCHMFSHKNNDQI